MKWNTPLTEALLLKRYKRFLADIDLRGEVLTVHVPNTGSMTSCWEPGWKCAVSKSENPKRKMAWTLEYTHNGESWIGVNTANANKLVYSWLSKGLLPEFLQYPVVQPEKKIGDSRIDFYLEGHEVLPPCYVEVKSVTLKDKRIAEFPDAVSERGQKHLLELMKLKEEGKRAAMVYVIQREDVERMRPAHAIDKKYGDLVKKAFNQGVEFYVYQCKMDLSEIGFGKQLPFDLE